jgi:hypothetical protein
MISEKDMEHSIIANPEKYLGEMDLKLLSQQHRIGNYIFDLLFEDRHGAKMIVEIQKGTLDRDHTYKILDYYHEYKENNPTDFIELMVIANKIPDERKKRLSNWGVSFKEISEDDFVNRSGTVETDENKPTSDILNNKAEKKDTLVMQHNNERDKLNSVRLPVFKPKFQTKFDKCDRNVQDIFLDLVNRFAQYQIVHITTDKPDYRLVKKYVFCEFVLLRQSLQINLRVDNHYLSSDLLVLNEMKDKAKPGKKWYTVRVNDKDEIEEASNLIDKVFKFSD